MDCRRCKHMKRFRRLIGGIECRCSHEKVEQLPKEIFGDCGAGFIYGADYPGEPKIKLHPSWCPLRERKTRKGRYVAEWDEKKGKIALKFKEGEDA